MELWAVVVAGGSGSRFGGLKQLEFLAGSRLIDRSVRILESSTAEGGVVVVVPASEIDRADLPGDVAVPGGRTRSESVRSGLAALPPSATHVLVHDAARPLASAALVGRVVAGLEEADAVVPVVAVTDTLRTVEGGSANRADFVAVQTPQGFRVETLIAAHEAGLDATDDASLVDAIGVAVLHVEGDPLNMKITGSTDLAVAEALLDPGVSS